MKNEWKYFYFKGSCIKEVDDKRRLLLFQIPGTAEISRVWVSMNLTQFEDSAGSGYFRKLWYKNSFSFSGYELIEGIKGDYTISAQALREHCANMDQHIRTTIQMRRTPTCLNAKDKTISEDDTNGKEET